MTHATIWSHVHDQFNEELATFVGGEGSLLYLKSLYGADSPQLQRAVEDREDSAAFSSWLRGTAAELQVVYASSLSPSEKRARKAEIIAARAAAYKERASALFHGTAYRDFPMGKVNNAYLDLYRLYEGEPDLYRDFYRKVCDSSMRRFIEAVSRIVKEGGDPKAGMRRALAAATGEEPATGRP